MRVVLEGQLRERRPLHVKDANGVECDVDATRLRRHRIGVLVDGSLVERIDFGDLGPSSRGGDVPSHCVELGATAAGKEHRRSLTCEGASYRAADRTTTSVD
jgi:hypothetical protein